MKYICGVDYSIGGPAACVHPDTAIWNSNECRFLYLSGTKSRIGDFTVGNVQFSGLGFIPKYVYDIERYMFNANKFISFMDLYNVEDVKIEGYSYGSKGRAIFNIGEATGLLKSSIVNSKKNLCVSQPTEIKKFATGKGNTNKAGMVKQFENDTGIDLLKVFNLTKTTHPADDIADAYYICKLLHNIRYK